jgi:DNA ligase (NAD+)
MEYEALNIKQRKNQNKRYDMKKPETQKEELELLKKLGFKVNPHFQVCKNIEEIENYYQVWKEKKE